MIRELQIVLAGFGGQGVLFAGKVIAYAGLIEDRELSWLPSYGPEMRGGTANCSVALSDEPIGSPLITSPNAFLAMNQPSFDKFIYDVLPDGVVVLDSDMVPDITMREDITIARIAATSMAEDSDLHGLGNIVMVGRLWAETQFCERKTLDAAIEKCVPPRKAALIEKNKQALELGISG